MEIPAEYAERVRELRDLYNAAEADLKNVGRVENKLIVTGINQLRYAAQHLVRALAEEDDDAIADDLDAAIRHAKRAIYDINDSAIQHYITAFEQFRRDFPRADLARVIGDGYHVAVREFHEARQHVESNRNAQENRQRFYQEAREHVLKMRNAMGTLESHRDDVIRAVKRDNWKRTAMWVSYALNALGLAV